MWWQLLLLVLVSAGFESLFLYHGLNILDEGWPLYASMQLHAGGVLYDEVFFVFPPGHLLSAWIAYALDPPGIVAARLIYAAFSVSLCAGIYLLGRRLMPPRLALMGALLLAVAAPGAHLLQLLFGYRYLVFSVLALLALSQRLRTGELKWSVLAGVGGGAALCFRLTPAFALGCAFAIAVLAHERAWRVWLRDLGAYTLGLGLVVVPVLAWFAASAGLETLWREVVIRPVAMTNLQSLPIRDLTLLPAAWERPAISAWFVPLQFRLYALLYLGYAIGLAVLWLRAFSQKRSFEHALLLAVAVFGGVYFLRSLVRSDAPHLYSALPPVCLLLAHLLSLAPRLNVQAALCAFVLVAWVFLMGSDRALDPAYVGATPLEVMDGRIAVRASDPVRVLDEMVPAIRAGADPEESILDLSASPLLYILTERRGPGRFDVVMPGTFLDDTEEGAFLARLRASPPAAVIWPGGPFDHDPERAVERTAPQIARWVRAHYQRTRPRSRYILLIPRQR